MGSQKGTLYGIHAVMEALDEAIPINKVFIQKDIHNERIRSIIMILKQREIPFQMVPKEKLNRLTTKNHQGIIALGAETEFQSIDAVLPGLFESGKSPLIAILDGITDVRNFGAIARSAECFGIDALVVPAQGSAMLNADAIQASAGALHKIPVCRELNFLKAVRYIKNSGLQLVSCTEKATDEIKDVDFDVPTAIILGSEGDGIHEDLLKASDKKVKIHISGEIQSLNVSVAAGVIFYESQRQRRQKV